MKKFTYKSKCLLIPFIILLFCIFSVSPIWADNAVEEESLDTVVVEETVEVIEETTDDTSETIDSVESETTNAIQMVIDLIDGLKSPESIVIDDESTITLVRNAYDRLSESEKSEVTNISKLEQCESTLAIRKEQQTLPADMQMYSYTFSIDSVNRSITIILNFADTRPNIMLLSPSDKEYWLPISDASGVAQVTEDDLTASTVEDVNQTIINISNAQSGNWVLKTSTPVSMLTQAYTPAQLSSQRIVQIQVNKESMTGLVDDLDFITDGNNTFVLLDTLKSIAAQKDDGLTFADTSGNIITISKDGIVSSSTGNIVFRVSDGRGIVEESASRPISELTGSESPAEPTTEPVTEPSTENEVGVMSILSSLLNNYFYYIVIIFIIIAALIVAVIFVPKMLKKKAGNMPTVETETSTEEENLQEEEEKEVSQPIKPKKRGLFGTKKDKVQEKTSDVEMLTEEEKDVSEMDELAKLKAEADKMWAAVASNVEEEKKPAVKHKEQERLEDEPQKYEYYTDEDVENDYTIEEYDEEESSVDDDYDDNESQKTYVKKKNSFFNSNRWDD